MRNIILIAALAVLVTAMCSGPVWAQKFIHITDLHVTTHTDTWPAVGEFDKDAQNFVNLRNAIVAQNPAFVICTGDIANSGLNDAGSNDADSWNLLTSATTGKLWKNGNTYYMNAAKTIPIYFVPGNHDSRKRSQLPHDTQSLSAYDAYIGKGTNAASGCTAPVYGSGETARDFSFTSGNMLFIGLYSGTDITNDLNWRNPEGSGLTSAQINFVRTKCQANPGKIKIISMHHPAVNPLYTFSYPHYSNWGTDYKDDQFEGAFYSIYDGTILQSSVGSDGKTFLQTCAAQGVAMVLQGHEHQNVVLDASGVKRAYSNGSWSQSSGTGVNYVQTAQGFNGSYRIINVTSPTAYTVSSPQLTTTLNFPGMKNSEWDYYPLMVEYGALSLLKIATNARFMPVLRMKYWVNGVFQSQIDNPASTVIVPWYANIAKGTSAMIKVEVTNSIGTTTAMYPIKVLNTSDSYYGRMAEGQQVTVLDPASGGNYTFKLQDVDVSLNPRQILMHVYNSGGTLVDQMVVQLNIPRKVTALPKLFILPTQISSTTVNEIMIAPYIEPSVNITVPYAGQSTNSNEVQVTTNYSGKNVPWETGGSSPVVKTSELKTLSYQPQGGTATNTINESYIWYLSGSAGTRDLAVSITDKFGSVVTKSVTVNYNPALPFYASRGPYGDYWTGLSMYTSPYNSSRVFVYDSQWDIASGARVDNSFVAFSRAEVVGRLGEVIWSHFYYNYWMNIPSGATAVYVVDKNQYNYSTLDGGIFGSITWKEIYNSMAFRLGKDNQGRYRVWASSSAVSRTPADMIDPEVPSGTWWWPPSGTVATYSPYTCGVTVTDNVGVTQVRIWNLSDGFRQTALAQDPYSPMYWYAPVPLVPGTNMLVAVAFDAAGNTVQIPPAGSPAITVTRTAKGDEANASSEEAKPAVTQLNNSTPNPLTQTAMIRYQLATPGNVSLKVYNISGELVKTLANEHKPAGYHSVRWDGKDANGSRVAAGVYLYCMQAGNYTQTNKMTVLR